MEVDLRRRLRDRGTRDDDALADEAVALGRRADVAVVFLGLPAGDESEGFDRAHMDLPADQVDLLRGVAAVNPTASSWCSPTARRC